LGSSARIVFMNRGGSKENERLFFNIDDILKPTKLA
jgi:hypothetical protein